MGFNRRALLRGLGLTGLGLAAKGGMAQSFLPGIPNVGIKADTGTKRSESGVGALMPWADVLWAVTYVSSRGYQSGTGTGLYVIDDRLQIQQRHVSNGVYANRLVHKESNQVIIGPYVIDVKGNVRVINDLLDERLTATMRHLTDPANRVYMLAMEGAFYEVDLQTLKVRQLFDLYKEFQNKQLTHFKGGWSSQGRVVVANNTFSDWNERDGELAEWDGKRWTVIERKPYMEAAGRTNFGAAIFTTGWDEASALFRVLIDGKWHRYRLPKASHAYDHWHTTEWTRIREVETERFLMDCHGMFYELAPMVYGQSVWGVRPISTHLRIIPDFCSFRGLLALAGNENTPIDDTNPLGGQSQSGIWFGKTDDLWNFGKPKGWGGPWRFTPVTAGEASEPFLMTGFERKVVHLKTDKVAEITVEVDILGNGVWEVYEKIKVSGYRYHVFPEGFSAHWVRLTSDVDCKATAEFYYT